MGSVMKTLQIDFCLVGDTTAPNFKFSSVLLFNFSWLIIATTIETVFALETYSAT